MHKTHDYKSFFENEIAIYFAPLYRYINSWGLQSDICEEIAQETMAIAWEKMKQLRDLDKARPWLFSIARNVIHAHYRKSNVRGFYTAKNKDDLIDNVKDISVEVLEILEKTEERIIVEKIVNQMDEKYRRVLILYYYYDHTLIEISKIMNINYNTVKTNHNRALNQFRVLYLKYEKDQRGCNHVERV